MNAVSLAKTIHTLSVSNFLLVLFCVREYISDSYRETQQWNRTKFRDKRTQGSELGNARHFLHLVHQYSLHPQSQHNISFHLDPPLHKRHLWIQLTECESDHISIADGHYAIRFGFRWARTTDDLAVATHVYVEGNHFVLDTRAFVWSDVESEGPVEAAEEEGAEVLGFFALPASPRGPPLRSSSREGLTTSGVRLRVTSSTASGSLRANV